MAKKRNIESASVFERSGIRAIRVRAIEVLLYIPLNVAPFLICKPGFTVDSVAPFITVNNKTHTAIFTLLLHLLLPRDHNTRIYLHVHLLSFIFYGLHVYLLSFMYFFSEYLTYKSFNKYFVVIVPLG